MIMPVSAKKGSERGDFDGAFRDAPVKVDQTYITPVETHNPIELHASVAVWNGDRLTMYETSQGVVNHRVVVAVQTPGFRWRTCAW